MSIMDVIRARLAALEPDMLELYDDSQEHAGHAGAHGGGGHYQLIISSRRFEGLGHVARHRLVYSTVTDMMRKDIHALAIKAYTPGELTRAFSR